MISLAHHIARVAGWQAADCLQAALEHRVPRPRLQNRYAESLGILPQPLAVAPADPRASRLLLALAREIVPRDLRLVAFNDEDGAYPATRRLARVGAPRRDLGQQ